MLHAVKHAGTLLRDAIVAPGLSAEQRNELRLRVERSTGMRYTSSLAGWRVRRFIADDHLFDGLPVGGLYESVRCAFSFTNSLVWSKQPPRARQTLSTSGLLTVSLLHALNPAILDSQHGHVLAVEISTIVDLSFAAISGLDEFT